MMLTVVFLVVLFLIVAIAVVKVLSLVRATCQPRKDFESSFLEQLRGGGSVQAIKWCSCQKTPLARILVVVLPLVGGGIEFVKDAAQRVWILEFNRAKRGLRHLPMLGVVALLLGVLIPTTSLFVGPCGCVDSERPYCLTRGISESLLWTVVGLGAAVLALILHRVLGSAYKNLFGKMLICRTQLINRVFEYLKQLHKESDTNSCAPIMCYPVQARSVGTQIDRFGAIGQMRKGVGQMAMEFSSTKGPFVLLLGPLACLLCLLICFLSMGMSLAPRVEMVSVAFALPQETKELTPTLVITSDTFEFRAHGTKMMSASRNRSRVDSTTLEELLDLIRGVFPDAQDLTVRCQDSMKLQELITILDACQLKGFVNLTVASFL